MRDDFHKIIIERERGGSSNKSKKTKLKLRAASYDDDFDSGAKKAPVSRKRQYGYDCKHLSDNINCLKQYLHKQVGRNWNDIYSEVKRVIPKGMHGDHIWSHVTGFVEIHCEEIDGQFYAKHGYLRRYPITGLYVHPVTNILCFEPHTSWRKEKREAAKNAPIVSIKINDSSEYKLIDGIWFYIEIGVVGHTLDTSGLSYKEIYDEEGKMRPGLPQKPVYGEVAHQQLSKKELKKLGLRNIKKQTFLPSSKLKKIV